MPVAKRLPHKLGMVLPSRNREGKALSAVTMSKVGARVRAWFAAELGADTEERKRLHGRYSAARGRVIVETVSEIWSYCTGDQFRTKKAGLVRLAEWVCREARQEAIGILVDGGMELVTV